nr:response regulator [Allomuricauda sp.]
MSSLFLLLLVQVGYTQLQSSRSNILTVDGKSFDINANVVYQDNIGFMWIGTNDGLFRYDGHDLIEYQFNVFEESSLPNNTVNSILEDDFGNLWIGTESYLVFFNRSEEKFSGFYKNTTASILGKSSKGVVYANLWKSGLLKVQPHTEADSLIFDTAHNYLDRNQHLPFNKRINSFVEDIHQRYWIATTKGILAVKPNGNLQKTNFEQPTLSLINYKENSFLTLNSQGLYILSYRKDDRKLETLDAYSFKTGNINGPASLVKHPYKKEYYVCTPNQIIKVYTKGNQLEVFENYISSEDIGESNSFKSLAIDKHQNIWIASSSGVFKLKNDGIIFERHNLPYRSSPELITALFAEPEGKLYTASTEGLYVNEEENEFSEVLSRNKLNGQINVIAKDFGSEELWLGVDNTLKRTKGLYSTAPTLETIKEYERGIKDILSLNSNETWIGLWSGGIDIINSETSISNFKLKIQQKLKNLNVSAFHLDKNNKLWIGTRGMGVYLADLTQERLQHFYPNRREGLNSNAILCFLELDDKIYIGTRGGGINVYDATDGTFIAYGKEHGLNSLTIAAMESDDRGNIWVSTVNGITLFEVKTERFTNFGRQDGLLDNQFNFNESAKEVSGGIYFANSKNLVKLNPKEYSINEELGKTIITEFEVLKTSNNPNNTGLRNLSSLTENEKIVLPYNENNIAIKFTSLDFTAPDKNKFAYMMEGVNDFWIYTSSENSSANYNGLNPGDYTFKVKSTNSHGVWNNQPAVLKFTIRPPFWANNTAKLLYVVAGILIILIGSFLVRNWFRLKKNLFAETVSHLKDLEHHKMKMVFFTDISHELRTPLTLIQGTIEKVIREGKYQLGENTAKRIYNNSLRIGRLIDQIMDIRKNDVGAFKLRVSKNNIVKDIKNLKNAFNDFAKINNITYKLICKEKEISAFYDLQIFEKVLFNLLSNAFKYTAENGRVEIRLSSKKIGIEQSIRNNIPKGMYVECTVWDNGLGIPKENLKYIFDRYYQSTKMPAKQVPGTGIGMELVQKLIKAHKGVIEVDSIENEFTQFTFLLPIERDHYEENQLLGENRSRRPSITTKTEYQVYEEITSNGVHQETAPYVQRPKILLVDDNNELRTMMREELFNEFDIIEAKNGKEGYQKVQEHRPNLIISDILMPVEDGIELLKNLKANEDLSHLPIFMLTAKDSEETKIECLSLGASDYIEKPFSPDFLKWKVKNTLQSRKSLKDKYSKIISVNTSEIELESNDEKLIKKLIQIVESSLEDAELSVEYLASEVGMSRANLYRKLQAILDETPVNFIKKIRLKRASQLLQKNRMYVSEIAYMTGFNNPKYFAKCFNKEFGVSPKEYAKQFEEKKENVVKPSLDLILSNTG